MKRVFIVNPKSANGKAFMISKELEKICLDAHLDSTFYLTTSYEMAVKLVKCLDCEDVVVYSVGGDGTLNSVINGLDKSRLSIVPAGTGNDFLKTLTGYTPTIDIGIINKRRFINVASFGIDAHVAYKANCLKASGVKNNVYFKSIEHVLPSYTNERVTINGQPVNLTLLAISNGRYYGGGIKIAPDASINDGQFDVISVNDAGIFSMINLFYKLLIGTHLKSVRVNYDKLSSIRISALKPLICNVDGEIIEDTDYNITLEPAKIRCFNEDNEQIKQLIKKYQWR